MAPAQPAPIEVDARTRLRPWRVEDVESLYEVVRASQEHLARWLAWAEHYTLDGADEFVARTLAEYRTGGLNFAVEVDGAIAGGCGVPRSTPEHREYEIGYWLAEPYTGRGIMTRSASALTDHLIHEHDAHRVQIAALAGNLPSRAVAERLRFRLEGTFVTSRWHRGAWHDMAWYATTEDEWQRWY